MQPSKEIVIHFNEGNANMFTFFFFFLSEYLKQNQQLTSLITEVK